jgi:phosphatidylserine decarboxylase
MITKYGYDVFFTVAAFCLILFVLAFSLVEPGAVRAVLVLLSLALLGFALNFFRDPNRTTPQGDKYVIAPADGKIVAVKKIAENEFFHSDAWQVSIFMSPLNVHVNRSPVSGIVRHTRYVKGKYFAAFEDKASEKNEQMIVGIEGTHQKVVVKQIAGFIARRIVCRLRPGDTITAGERIGMIRFGSRVDVLFPVSAVVSVKVGDKTSAGETILGEFSQANSEKKT